MKELRILEQKLNEMADAILSKKVSEGTDGQESPLTYADELTRKNKKAKKIKESHEDAMQFYCEYLERHGIDSEGLSEEEIRGKALDLMNQKKQHHSYPPPLKNMGSR